MKLSCNGCRILRKGCSENCIIKPCLEWINSAESQANATLFLAKYYGRTGFLNLITAAPQHLSPVVFKSLLYEACGRLVNPTYGSLGLFWTGEWAQCEAAVGAVLSGSIIDGVTSYDWHTSRTFGDNNILSTCDIRHVYKRTNVNDVRGRIGFKRMKQVMKPKPQVGSTSMDSALLWKPNCESESMELPLNQVAKMELNLDLTLGFRCQSTCSKKTH